MKNKLNLILITLIAFLTASGCSQNSQVQNQNKADIKQTAANKAADTNEMMKSDTASTQTLSTTNINSNSNLNTNTSTNR
jgi:hypothetical protein